MHIGFSKKIFCFPEIALVELNFTLFEQTVPANLAQPLAYAPAFYMRQGQVTIYLLQNFPVGFEHFDFGNTQRIGPALVEPSLHFSRIADFPPVERNPQPHVVIVASSETFIEQSRL